MYLPRTNTSGWALASGRKKFNGIRNKSRKDVNQKINRRPMASMFNLKFIFEVAKNCFNDRPFSQQNLFI
jgi:hypothetical protein